MVAPINPKVIFFDFDGVLAESAEIKVEAFRSLYAAHGPEVLEKVLAHHADHEGISRVEKIRHCHREYLGVDLDEAALTEVCARYSGLVEDAVVDCPAVAGAESFLAAEHGLLGLYVVSGTPEDELRRICERRGIDHRFDGIFGSPRLKETIVAEVMEIHGYKPDEAIFVGDAMTDHRAAEATGVAFIGRVDANRRDPFPEGTRTMADLTTLSMLIRHG